MSQNNLEKRKENNMKERKHDFNTDHPVTFVKDGKLEIKGTFGFNVFSENFNETDWIPFWHIEFKMSPELVQDLSAFHGSDSAIEQVSEALKQGFIKFLKEN